MHNNFSQNKMLASQGIQNLKQMNRTINHADSFIKSGGGVTQQDTMNFGSKNYNLLN